MDRGADPKQSPHPRPPPTCDILPMSRKNTPPRFVRCHPESTRVPRSRPLHFRGRPYASRPPASGLSLQTRIKRQRPHCSLPSRRPRSRRVGKASLDCQGMTLPSRSLQTLTRWRRLIEASRPPWISAARSGAARIVATVASEPQRTSRNEQVTSITTLPWIAGAIPDNGGRRSPEVVSRDAFCIESRLPPRAWRTGSVPSTLAGAPRFRPSSARRFFHFRAQTPSGQAHTLPGIAPAGSRGAGFRPGSLLAGP